MLSLLLGDRTAGREYDRDALAELVLSEHVFGEKTVFTDIRRMLSGHRLTWRDNRLQTTEYWSVSGYESGPAPATPRDAAAFPAPLHGVGAGEVAETSELGGEGHHDVARGT